MGPLTGVRVIELAGIGPAPFCGMLLADLGADVVRIDRPAGTELLGLDRLMSRNKRSIVLDLKQEEAVDVLLKMTDEADVLIEGLRPGVAERLGIGPDICLGRNPRLVFGRMTGWGQHGPLSPRAGHDINYIALAGALDAIGARGGPPLPPLNLVGDFGGGALYLALGVMGALIERDRSGCGQVIDAAMTDGVASLLTMFHELAAAGWWGGQRGTNLLDGGAPFYATYETADGRFMAVGALEPHFYEQFLSGLGLDPADLPPQYDREGWPALRERIAAQFLTGTRSHWSRVFAEVDACVTPVLALDEAPQHPHNIARSSYVKVAGVTQAAPAPRFSRSESPPPRPAPIRGEHTDQILDELDLPHDVISRLRASGAVS
jgi:alpha-methylacyl-CoA racemase